MTMEDVIDHYLNEFREYKDSEVFSYLLYVQDKILGLNPNIEKLKKAYFKIKEFPETEYKYKLLNYLIGENIF